MKYLKLLTLLLVFTAMSCTESKFEDTVYLDFDSVKCWVVNYQDQTNETEILEHAEHLANPNATTFIYFYPSSVDVSMFQNATNQTELINLMGERIPQSGYIAIPDEPIRKLEFY